MRARVRELGKNVAKWERVRQLEKKVAKLETQTVKVKGGMGKKGKRAS